MADRIRFHLNEHVDPAIAVALQRAGIEVTTTIQAGLRTQNDEAHLRFARLKAESSSRAIRIFFGLPAPR